MLRVIRGMPMDGRGERLLDEALAGGADGHLHVVRTRARERQLREMGPGAGAGRLGVSFGARVVRLSDFVHRIAGRRTHLRAALGAAERALILEDLARAEARPPLRGVAGLAAWLGALFSRLKQGDVFSPDRAFRSFASLDRDDPGAAEAMRLFGVYQDRLVHLGLYDEDGLYLELARDLGTPELPFDRVMTPRRRLVVEGFYQTNIVERAIFERLFTAFEESFWLLDVPDGVATDAFGAGVVADVAAGGETIRGDLSWLASLGASAAEQPAEGRRPSPNRPPIREIQGRLFESAGADDTPAVVPHGGAPSAGAMDWIWSDDVARRLTLVRAPDERTEARFLAERAAALVREDPSASVVIAYPSDRDAASLLREACADVDLALDVAALRSLAECPIARTLGRLLDLAVRDFPRDRVVAALRGAGAGVRFGDARLTASAVDRVSRAAGVVAGADAWLRKIDRLVRTTEAQLAAARDSDAERPERALREAAEVRAGMAEMIAIIPGAGFACTSAEFETAVRQLMERFRLDAVEGAGEGPPDREGVEAISVAARAAAAIDRILGLYGRSDALVGARARPWADHVAAFRAILAAEVVPWAPPLRRGAALVGIRELRGLTTDHLLVGGLSEDAFPGRTESAPLLDEADAARAGARTAGMRRREAEHLLVHALRSPRKSLVLSRPEQRDGCPALPALALDLVRERFGVPDTEAEAELAKGEPIGRITRDRLAARALWNPAAAPDDAQRLLDAVRTSGRGGSLAWERLCAERSRFDRGRVGRFEGMLEPAAQPLLATVAGDGGDRVVTSAARLDDYAKCPQLYFFKRVLRVSPEPDLDPDVTPIERGNLVHRILQRFHDGLPSGVTARDKAERLDRIAREELALLRADGLIGELLAETLTAGLLDALPADRPGLFRRYLDYEEKRAVRFTPTYFEARFGPSPYGRAEAPMSEDPLPLVDVEVGGRTVSVSLSGAMDRIDVDEAGGEVRVVVLDYKTGDTLGLRQKNLRGRAFQLPLYAALAPKLLASRFPGRRVRTVAAVYYDLGGSKVDLVEPLVDACDASDVMPRSRKRPLPDGQLAALVAGAVRRAGDVVAAVRRGVFHPTAIDGFKDGCAKCDFQSACRGAGEDARLSRMTDANLFPQVVALVDDGADSAREDDPEGEA